MRTLAVVAVLAVVVLVAGGQLVEARAGQAVAAGLEARGRDVGDADVDLHGAPVLYHVAVGEIPAMDIVLTGYTTVDPAITFTRVELHLEDVSLDPVAFASGEPTDLTIGTGSVRAVLDRAELARLVREQRPGWDVAIEAMRIVATGTVDQRDVRVVLEPRVGDGVLELVPTEVAAGDLPPAAVAGAFEARVGLPALPGGIVLTGAEVVDGALVLSAEVTGPLDLSG